MTCSVSPGGRRRSTDHAERVRRADRRVRDVRRDEERFPFAHEVVHDPVALADAHFDVALQLVEKLFGIDLVKIVPRVGAHDDHDEEIAPVVEVTVAHRRLEEGPVLFNPGVQIDRRLDGGRDGGSEVGGGGSARLAMTEAISFRGQRQTRRFKNGLAAAKSLRADVTGVAQGFRSLAIFGNFRLHTSRGSRISTVPPFYASDLCGAANN